MTTSVPSSVAPNKAEAGLTDLQAMVDYMAEFANTGAGDDPLPVPTRAERGARQLPGRCSGVVRAR